MTKKIFAFFIMVLFFFTTGTHSISASQRFTDVDDTYWAKEEITYLAQQEIIQGYHDGNFGVNDHISRIQAATMIIRALDLDTNYRPILEFKDIVHDDDGYSIIATIADEGIMKGNENGEFKPNEKLTRAQMATILVKAFNLQGQSTYSFRDVSDKHWASSAIKSLYQNNITTGYSDNTFKPNNHITRTQFAVFMARVLNPEFREAKASCFKPNNVKNYVVNVAATTLWQEPNPTRAIDIPSIMNPVDLTKWTKSLSYQQKLWLVGKIDTQALYGQEVTILQSSGNWYKVAVKDQYTPKNSQGYPGWVPKSHIREYYPNYENCKIAIVQTETANVYNSASTTGPFLQISFNTILPIIKEDAHWIQVSTPTNEIKFMRTEDVKVFSNFKSIPKPTPNDIVATAKKFLGLPYLWAGNSGYGFDCSGFTYSIYKQHGILIPRDSTVQASLGTAISKNNLQPGDLMFFAYNNGKGKIHHVAMYIGNGQMIHSPNSSKTVEIISINTEPYKSEFTTARSYLP